MKDKDVETHVRDTAKKRRRMGVLISQGGSFKKEEV